SYAQLFAARAAVGIGESCYGSVSPSFVAEHFPKERRGRVLALFSMAVPVGSALGYILGGVLGHSFGWRTAFFVAGIPGLVLSALALTLVDPRKPPSVPASPASGERGSSAQATTIWAEYRKLAANRSWLFCTLGMAAMTFGMGAMAVWMPTFYHRTWNLDVGRAGTLFGAVTVLAGLVGSLAGGWLADKRLPRDPAAYFTVSGLGLLAAVPFAVWAVTTPRLPAAVAGPFIAETCAFLNMGPLNAVIVAVTPERVRSTAFAANIFFIHLLGDAVSPTLVGMVSDAAGLRAGVLLAVGALAAAGALCLWGTRSFAADEAAVEIGYA
ncbi:MAG: MFS transporter, partial [Elusimicrobia bacterium]|nr:MFS transporter [Elusimicrobiota bacterium]